MNGIQEINLAYEMHLLISDGWTVDEAREEIIAVLETEYRKELLSEVDEEILYFYDDVVTDIMGSIEALLERMTNSIAVC
jgi:hypothetical protein